MANMQLNFLVTYSNGKVEQIATDVGDTCVVGRRSNAKTQSKLCHVFLADRYISRRHFRFIHCEDDENVWWVEDLGSSNGTKLNGKLVKQAMPYPEGGTIVVGTTRLTMKMDAPGQDLVDARTQLTDADSEALTRAFGDHETVAFDRETMLADDARSEEMATQMTDDSSTQLAQDMATQLSSDGPEEMETQWGEATQVAEDAATKVASETEETLFSDLDDSDEEDGWEKTVAAATQLNENDGQTVAAPNETVFDAPTSDRQTLLEGAQPDQHSLFAQLDEPKEKKPKKQAVEEEGAPGAEECEIDDAPFDPDLINVIRSSAIFPFLAEKNLLDEADSVKYFHKARRDGASVFRVMMESRRGPAVKYLDEILEAVAERFDLDLIDEEWEINHWQTDPNWMTLEQAEELGALVLCKADPMNEEGLEYLVYASIDPFDVLTRDWLERHSGCLVAEPILCHPRLFLAAINRLKDLRSKESSGEQMLYIDFAQGERDRLYEHAGDDLDQIPNLVGAVFQDAHHQRASDIHIEPTEQFLLVRNRVDGILHQHKALPQSIHPNVVSYLKILSGMDVAEKRRPQDGRISTNIFGNSIDIRVSSYPTVYGEKFVLRLLDESALQPSIEELGIPQKDLALLKDKIAAPYGMIMISGPTGSGKTTTLYSCLNSVDRRRKNVLTVEDPVEYKLDGVHQMQVNHKIGLTFFAGLRTILRQDPDVIMVGETRDDETAQMVVQSALTGHVVFSTIHTNDAMGVVTRLIDMNLEPFLVASALSLCVAQRLVRRICPHCKTWIKGRDILTQLEQNEGISEDRLAYLDIVIHPEENYMHGAGCARCRQTGYLGRVAVFELFDVNEEVRNLIVSPSFSKGGTKELKKLAKEMDMTTLVRHGMKLVEDGKTTFNEVVRVLGEKG
ncbi:ATPase, T2SS/T4P/T4SS family [Magnetococcales bacterium HHB-1]